MRRAKRPDRLRCLPPAVSARPVGRPGDGGLQNAFPQPGDLLGGRCGGFGGLAHGRCMALPRRNAGARPGARRPTGPARRSPKAEQGGMDESDVLSPDYFCAHVSFETDDLTLGRVIGLSLVWVKVGAGFSNEAGSFCLERNFLPKKIFFPC